MISSVKGLALAAVAAATLPVVANATPVTDNLSLSPNYYTYADVVFPGGQVEYQFTVLEKLRIDQFTVSGTGKKKDVKDVTFGFTPGATNSFIVTVIGATAYGGGFVPGTIYQAGDLISFYFNDGVSAPVSTTLSFTTSQVPLPAAGGLLMLALAGTGAVAARKKKSA